MTQLQEFRARMRPILLRARLNYQAPAIPTHDRNLWAANEVFRVERFRTGPDGARVRMARDFITLQMSLDWLRSDVARHARYADLNPSYRNARLLIGRPNWAIWHLRKEGPFRRRTLLHVNEFGQDSGRLA